MERLTFDGDFCEIAQCTALRYGSACEDGTCTQRKVWARLKAYEDTGRTPDAFRALGNLQRARDLISRSALQQEIRGTICSGCEHPFGDLCGGCKAYAVLDKIDGARGAAE